MVKGAEQNLTTCPHGYLLHLQAECPICGNPKTPDQLESVEEEQIREFARRIENLPLQIDDKANFILTKAGLKPASNLDLVIRTHD